MTFRERYLETILFGKPDRVPLLPGGPRESTLRVWHSQGLPEGQDHYSALLAELGLPPIRQDAADPGVSFDMIPMFEEKVLEHRGGHCVVQDWMGAIVEISDEFDVTYLRFARDFVTRKWYKFPVESRDDFGRMKERYQVDTPGRFPEDFAQKCQSIKDSGALVTVGIRGPFWKLRDWCGFEKLCMLFLDDPDFVLEMIGFWTEFISRVLARMHKHIGLDRLLISEDMAYKVHSMISPDMTRRFIVPAYREWISQVEEHGCRIIDLDSDGYIGELIPVWIEAGINCCNPMEVAAGNDLVAFRREFGRKMAYTGGIDKRAIAAGGRMIEEEVMRVVPPLFREGGYIPGCDHAVPADISWPNYVHYSKLLAQLSGWL